MRRPKNWPFLINPYRPSWGEAYASIAARMLAAVESAFDSVDEGDVVLVSHQLPIWTTHLALAGERFMHDPRKRRCALSSITTFEIGETMAPPSEERADPADAPTTATTAAAAGQGASLRAGVMPSGRRVVEVGYVEPAAALLSAATDVGAV